LSRGVKRNTRESRRRRAQLTSKTSGIQVGKRLSEVALMKRMPIILKLTNVQITHRRQIVLILSESRSNTSIWMPAIRIAGQINHHMRSWRARRQRRRTQMALVPTSWSCTKMRTRMRRANRRTAKYRNSRVWLRAESATCRRLIIQREVSRQAIPQSRTGLCKSRRST